jgi:hypothetical protein
MRQQLKAQEDRKLLPQRSSHSFEQRKKEEENIVYGPEMLFGCTSPRNSAFSRPIWRTAQHV